MGTVTFNTDVDKTVDITKNVLLDVDKNVFSDVDLEGSLATAEASADALGGSGTGDGGGSFITLDFLIDDADDFQTTVIDGLGNSNTGTAPGPNPPPPNFTIGFPDAATFDSTDIPDGLRTFELEVISGNGQVQLTSNVDPSLLEFSTPSGTTSDNSIVYESDADGDFVGGDSFSIILSGADLADPTNAIIFEDLTVDPGQVGDTVRAELTFEDQDGDSATGAFYFDDIQNVDLAVPLGLFTGDIAAPAPGTMLLPGVFEVGQTTDDIDFDDLAFIEIELISNLALSDFALAPGENPSNAAFDVSVDLIRVESREFVPGDDFGVLAEVDTFSQVSEQGAFAFAEALAALDPDSSDTMAFL